MNTLRKGDIIVIDKNPCKVTIINKSSPGKHDHAQYNITGMNILTGKKYNTLFKHHDKPNYVKTTSKKIYCSYLDDDGYAYITNNMGESEEYLVENKKMKEKIKQYEDGCYIILTLCSYNVKDNECKVELITNIEPLD